MCLYWFKWGLNKVIQGFLNQTIPTIWTLLIVRNTQPEHIFAHHHLDIIRKRNNKLGKKCARGPLYVCVRTGWIKFLFWARLFCSCLTFESNQSLVCTWWSRNFLLLVADEISILMKNVFFVFSQDLLSFIDSVYQLHLICFYSTKATYFNGCTILQTSAPLSVHK